MAIKAMMVDILKLANGIIPGTKEGDHLVSFPGGVQFIVPQEVIDNMNPAAPETDNINPVRVERIVRKTNPRHDHPQPEVEGEVDEDGAPIDPERDITSRVCIECGRTVKQTMPSGKCYACADVKCPTCGAAAKRADMTGQYCPNCLKRPGRE